MRHFTEADVKNEHIFTEDHRTEFAIIPPKGVRMVYGCSIYPGQSEEGYGAKITTEYKISFEGKMYRVYATCYSNAASHWFIVKGRKIHVS